MESLEQILKSRFFVVPENQRGFSWSKKQLEELLSDLKLAGSNSKSHYMGPIIITRDKDGDLTEDNYNPGIKCILEDGQQRLTAFFLMIRALQVRFEEIDGCETVDSKELQN